MKKMLLYFCSILLFSAQLSAQNCTPGTNFADSTYGIWPDTTTNFPPAMVNEAYSEDLNFKVPSEVSADITGGDPALEAFIGSPIQSFKVTAVDGLPSGYDFACNTATCEYLGGENGCANVYGTTVDAGVYDVSITVEGVILVVLFPGLPETPVTQPLTFGGYKIEVGAAGTIENIIAPITVAPNPANESISLHGITSSMEVSEVSILNLEGKVVRNRNLALTNDLNFNLEGIQSGIYFVKVAHKYGAETIKFIKE
jgi:hypothetical protein